MRVVLDTNILFSALLFHGKPREVFQAAIDDKFVAVSSPILVEELFELLRKKSKLTSNELDAIKEELEQILEIVFPRRSVKVVRDQDDDRVLEAATEGKCEYIVTGDRDLLDPKKYQKILILTPGEFLEKWFEK